MARRSYSPDQIIKKLRETEVLLSQGSTIGEAASKIEVTEQTYYRWRREYGSMRIAGAIRSKELELASFFLERTCGAIPYNTVEMLLSTTLQTLASHRGQR